MAYSEPTNTGDTQYTAFLTSVSDVGGSYPITVTCTVGGDNLNTPEMSDVFQRLIDLLSASKDFTVTAQRLTQYRESATPTA